MIKQIILFVSAAFILRIIFIPQGALSFHYDMARDAFEAQKIWRDKDLKIQGPPTSTPGLYHGVLYYYLIAIPYGLSQGNPQAAAIFLSFLSSLTVIPIFLIAKDLFKSYKLALLAGLLFAVSFEATQYGPWLSNPNPAMLGVSIFFLGLLLWQKGKTQGLYIATLAAALSTQFQFFLIYLFFLIPVFKYLFRIKVTTNEVSKASIVALLGLVNFIIAAIKFNAFQNILGGFLNISISSQIDFRTKFTELALNYIDNFTNLFINNFLPINVFLGGLLGLLVIYSIRKHKFIIFCLLSNFPIFIFGGHSNVYANIGLVVPAILGIIVLLKNLSQKNMWISVVLIFLIVISNLYAIFKNSPKGQISLVIPNDMILKNQLSLIDQTYKLAEGKPFSINTLTLPLWTNTTWAYLYSWYGKEKYEYVPSFYGRDQIGLLGEKELPKIEKPQDTSFFIIEPQVGIPERFFNTEIEGENSKTEISEEFSYNQLKLQLRKPKVDE